MPGALGGARAQTFMLSKNYFIAPIKKKKFRAQARIPLFLLTDGLGFLLLFDLLNRKLYTSIALNFHAKKNVMMQMCATF